MLFKNTGRGAKQTSMKSSKHAIKTMTGLMAGLTMGFCALLGTAQAQTSAPHLKVVSVDVEGGAATLFVTPEGKSLLIDTGWPAGLGGWPHMGPPPGTTMSSADRIVAAAKALGLDHLDYVIITHYHIDHVGGLGDLMAQIPVGTFIDHGPNREFVPAGHPVSSWATQSTYAKYLEETNGHPRLSVSAGTELHIGSMTLTFVSSDAKPIDTPLPGAGQPNPACQGVQPMAADGGEENIRSVASVIGFGQARIAAFGDLSWNGEMDLACPIDKVGKVDLLIVTQHGSNLSSNPASVDALAPVVAIMGNGPAKGGDVGPIDVVAHSPRLQGFWRLHSSAAHPQSDGPADYVANLAGPQDSGFSIEADVAADGEIKVTNLRNGFSKTYRAAPQ